MAARAAALDRSTPEAVVGAFLAAVDAGDVATLVAAQDFIAEARDSLGLPESAADPVELAALATRAWDLEADYRARMKRYSASGPRGCAFDSVLRATSSRASIAFDCAGPEGRMFEIFDLVHDGDGWRIVLPVRR